jgi:signal transduction histidine kinase
VTAAPASYNFFSRIIPRPASLRGPAAVGPPLETRRMGAKLSIFQKGLILLAVPLLFQLTFFAVLLKMELDQVELERLAVHTKEVIAQTETSYRHLLEGVSHVRRLVIAAGSEEARPSAEPHDAVEKAPDEFARLEQLVSDNPPQKARVEAAAEQAQRLRGWLRQVNDLIAAGRRDEAAALVRDPEGQQRLDSLRGKLDDILAVEERLDRDRLRSLGDSHRQQNWVMGAGIALSILLALAVGLVFGHDVSGRLARLADNLRRWGEKKELTPPLAGSDEVARLDRVFRGMAQALRDREQENEMFIYSVSHDLRSPLVNLQGFGEELGYACRDLRAALAADPPDLRRAREVAEKDAPESLGFIRTAVTRLAGIIDALLRLSRAGRVEYRPETVGVEDTVRRVAASLAAAVKARRAEVVIGPLPPARGDATAVEQVFANLVGNAVAYLDPSRPGRVEVGALAPDDPASPPGLRTYFVKDNGLGIPAAYQETVFRAFQRLHPDAGPGEGVGLALVSRMVGRLGGKIWLESAPGVGSTFFVALPPPDGPPPGPAAGAAQA